MRAGRKPEWIENSDGALVGVYLGADFTAEHEWGIERLLQILGVDGRRAPGVRRRIARGAGQSVRLYVGAQHALLLGMQPFLLDSIEEQILDVSRKARETPCSSCAPKRDSAEERSLRLAGCGAVLDKAVERGLLPRGLRIWPGDPMGTAWDGESFGILTGDKDAPKLRELHEAFGADDAAVWLGRTTGNPFENCGLVVCIASRIPSAQIDAMREHDLDAERLTAASDKTGIVKRLNKAGRTYFACSPRWRKAGDAPSAHPVVYWLNPTHQDENAFGWFTVEELDQWIDGKGPIPGRGRASRAKGGG